MGTPAPFMSWGTKTVVLQRKIIKGVDQFLGEKRTKTFLDPLFALDSTNLGGISHQ